MGCEIVEFSRAVTYEKILFSVVFNIPSIVFKTVDVVPDVEVVDVLPVVLVVLVELPLGVDDPLVVA